MIITPTPECQLPAAMLTEAVWPWLMMEPVCITHSVIRTALNMPMKRAAFLFIAPNFDLH